MTSSKLRSIVNIYVNLLNNMKSIDDLITFKIQRGISALEHCIELSKVELNLDTTELEKLKNNFISNLDEQNFEEALQSLKDFFNIIIEELD